MNETLTEKNLADWNIAVGIGRLALAFSRVNRVTYHEDGVTLESDTDHSIMLALLGVQFCPPHLDPNLVMAFSVVHDLPEVKCGDVSTLGISAEGLAAKKVREAEALKDLCAEHPGPIADLMARYEAQVEPEARFVKTLDKVLPKVTHMLNQCKSVVEHGLTYEEFAASHEKQFANYSKEYADCPEALELLRVSMVVTQKIYLSLCPTKSTTSPTIS